MSILSRERLRGLHVLIVDDDRDAREALEQSLQFLGARADGVASAKEARSFLERFRPDVLLSDLSMPEEDGYTLLTSIRRLPNERGGNVPAAAVTAIANPGDRRRAFDVGFQALIPKPFGLHEIAEAVASLARLPSA